MAEEVVGIFLNQVFPRFGAPLGISSDRGSCFIAGIVGQISKALGIQWDLHTPCWPQERQKE